MPTVRASVIVNTFNYARFVGAAIDSALAQSHPDTEVIVVDDGSTDASRAVIAGFGERVRPVFKANGGQGSAFNAGYAAARGEVVIFLDADDTLMPTAVATAVALCAEPGVVHVHWPAVDVDAEGRPTGETSPDTPLPEGDVLAQLVDDGPLQWGITPSSSANAWAKAYLEEVMPVPEEQFRIGADAYLVALAPLHGELRAATAPHSHYRRHGANRWGGSFDEVLAKNLEVTAGLAPLVAEHARRRGVAVDPERWRERSWESRLTRALQALDAVVRPRGRFVLIDGCELGLDSSSGRQVIPFKERDGDYWGAPADDRDAIAELRRLRRGGAEHLVLAWPSFWWTEEYPGFVRHLRQAHRCVHEDGELVIFALRG